MLVHNPYCNNAADGRQGTDLTMDPKERSRQWLKKVMAATGLNAVQLAEQAGLSPTTITRAKKSDHQFALSFRTIAKISAATGIPEPSEKADRAFGFAEEALTPIDYGTDSQTSLPPNQIDYQLHSKALDLAGYLPGDFLRIDMSIQPRPGDAVIAQVYNVDRGSAETILRLLDPPYLLPASTNFADSKPLLIDNERVRVVGVVLKSWRERQVVNG